jgi:predicted transposase YbfD/YdcC
MQNFPPREKKLNRAERQEASTTNKGHGRTERRTLLCSTGLNTYLDWPHVAQAFKLTRERTYRGRTSVETVYGITSLSRERASACELLDIVRNHWGIENKVFHVRDVTMGEDHCRVRKGFAPHLLSSLRNSLLNLLRLKGCKNIAETFRRHAALPLAALSLLKGEN